MECATCGRKFDTAFPNIEAEDGIQITLEHMTPNINRPNVVHKIGIYVHDAMPGKGDK